MIKEITVTEEGKRKLEAELEELKTVKRKEVVEAIRVALSFGDISENSEYDEAKIEQGKTETRINELEEQLRHVKVISESEISTDTVSVGNKVLVLRDGKEIFYQIVGSTEVVASNDGDIKRISDLSPIGKALIGKTINEEVTVVTPSKTFKLLIKEISK